MHIILVQLLNRGEPNTIYAAENNLVHLIDVPKGAKIKMNRGRIGRIERRAVLHQGTILDHRLIR